MQISIGMAEILKKVNNSALIMVILRRPTGIVVQEVTV